MISTHHGSTSTKKAGRRRHPPSHRGWFPATGKGQRPSGNAAASSPPARQTRSGSHGPVTSTARNGNSAPCSATSNKSRQNGSSNGSAKTGVKPEGTATQSQSGSDFDQRIAALEETVGIKLYRWVLREYGHANQPHLVRDMRQKKILDVLESATRGLRRM